MVNYDLPWNPNRLEQRFGRIHRIGQTEVCHLWNLVAKETREGEVYDLLLRKLEEERKALGGKVFDVLGKITFDNKPLRELLIQAIRYGESPEVKAQLIQVMDAALDRQHLIELIEERALVHDSMDMSQVMKIKEEMERAEARKLQPHFIASFFLEAFKHLGGSINKRESERYEITHVPTIIRQRDRMIGTGEAVLTKYERICFEKDNINIQGKPQAAFVCPGHPLLDSTIDVLLEKYRDLLKRGSILVDANDPGEEVRALFYLEHAIKDGRVEKSGEQRIISKRMQFVEIDSKGETRNVGFAPYLDYRPASEVQKELVSPLIHEGWMKQDLEAKAVSYAVETIVPEHLVEVKKGRNELIEKTTSAVKDRLTKEITYWDHRASELKEQELAGKVNARTNSGKARQRADELESRLQKRLADLELERKISALPPVAIGGALVVPMGLLIKLKSKSAEEPDIFAKERERVKAMAMRKVMEIEANLGYKPIDVSEKKVGYDIESKVPGEGKLRFIEVKGRAMGATTVTITKNEILTGLNKPDDFILALV
jgi:hypothetical protein